jgi:hypothetical protein
MHGSTHGHLDRLQIEMAALAPLRKDEPQQLIYFARDLGADRFRRFFSPASAFAPPVVPGKSVHSPR